MKIIHHLIENTHEGIQETFITDLGHIELWGSERVGYKWRFTSDIQEPTNDGKTYLNRHYAIEAILAYMA